MLARNGFLRSSILMLLASLLAAGLALAGIHFSAGAQATAASQIAITSPQDGDALQGVISINGTSAADGFRSAEIDFAYQNDPTKTWFVVQQTVAAIADGPLARWDTTTISDGVYRLRLQVILQNGQVLESQVAGLRVRNYTQVETSVPRPANAVGNATVESTATALPDFRPQQATLAGQPTNPAQVSLGQMESSAQQGILIVFGVMATVGIYFGIRALARR